MIILTGANNINQNFWYNFRFENNSLVSDFDRSHFVSALDQAPNVSSRIPSNVILEIPTYNNTNKTLVPTQSLFEFLNAKKINNISVIPRGVDVKKFHPHLRCKKIRSELGILDSCPTILSVSRLAREKNLDLVVDCFYELKKKYGQMQLIFVGSGPYMNKLKKSCPDALFVG